MKGSMKFILFVGVLSLALTQANHKKLIDSGMKQTDRLVKEEPDNTAVRVDTMREKIEDIKYDKYSIIADLSEFPAMNPVVVNFAVSLIIVAALLQLLNILVFKKDIAWIVFLLIIAGLVAAIISGNSFHPHTTGLAQRAAMVVEMHERWAQWTVRAAFLALILQIIHLFITRFDKVMIDSRDNTPVFAYKKSRLFMVIIAMLMIISASCVIRAGYLGAQLVHNERVNPQGKFLDQ